MPETKRPSRVALVLAPLAYLSLFTGAAGLAIAAEGSEESQSVQRSREAGLGRTAISPPVAADQLGPHGALAMAVQQKELDQLLQTREPPRIDPVALTFVTPRDNETTPARVALGRRLYFEPRLSSDGTVACATCHDTSRGFTDQRPTSVGVRGQLGQRNAPTTMNALLMQTQFLDGRAPMLEDQAKLPIVNPIEMGQPNGQAAIANIAGDPEYQAMFQSAYGRPPNYDDAGRAIAAFERTLVFLDSPFRRFVQGDQSALSASALRGLELYNLKGRCVTCHPLNGSNPIGSDGRFHNIGVAARTRNFEALARNAMAALDEQGGGPAAIDRLALQTNLSELGRFMVTKDRSDIGAFKTMQVTNVGITAPYFHDGSMRTLWDVIDHYNKGGEANAFLDGGIEPLDLSEDEIDDLVAFLFSLTDQRFADFNKTEMERQRQIAKVDGKRPFRDEALAHRKKLLFQERVMGNAPLGGGVKP